MKRLVLYVTPALTFRNFVFRPERIYVFCVDLRKSSNYFPIKHKLTVFITEVESVFTARYGLGL